MSSQRFMSRTGSHLDLFAQSLRQGGPLPPGAPGLPSSEQLGDRSAAATSLPPPAAGAAPLRLANPHARPLARPGGGHARSRTHTSTNSDVTAASAAHVSVGGGSDAMCAPMQAPDGGIGVAATQGHSAAHRRPQPPRPRPKLGTFEGVFVPVVLSIWGIIVLLRYGFILGQAGLVATIAMFSLGYFVTTMTTLSLSAIATNGVVGGGGPYYMISRSLGPEFGGSIGIVFYLGTVFAGAMSLLGFVEPLLNNFGASRGSAARVLPDTGMWPLAYASLLLLVCLGICLVGSQLFARTSAFLGIVLMTATSVFMLSMALRRPFDIPERHVHFHGFNRAVLASNMWPEFSTSDDGTSQTMFSIFSLIFPACSGILTGASMSGDLRSPGRSIPAGTLGAQLFTYSLYVILAVAMAASIDRETLKVNMNVMQEIALIPQTITFGVIATSVFGALGNIIGAAKMLEAMAIDNLLPVLAPFGTVMASGEPGIAIVFTWASIQLLLVFVKDMNQMGPFLTMASLLTFGVFNLACFVLKMSGSPNFRPGFPHFSLLSAAVGFIGCFAFMIVVDMSNALLSIAVCAIVFSLIHYYCPPKSWGDVTQSLIYHQVRKYLLRLDVRKQHVKFWRPQILLLVDDPRLKYHLIKFMNDLKKGGLLILGHVLRGKFEDQLAEYKMSMPSWLRFIDIAQIKAFVQVTIAPSERAGAQSMLTGSGLGAMNPNMIVLGFYGDSLLDTDSASSGESGGHSDADLSDPEQLQARTSRGRVPGLPKPHSPESVPAELNEIFAHRPLSPRSPPTPAAAAPPAAPQIAKVRRRLHTRQSSLHVNTDVEDQAVLDELQADPLVSSLSRSVEAVGSIQPCDYVGIIEDSLALGKSVAIARGFNRMSFPQRKTGVDLGTSLRQTARDAASAAASHSRGEGEPLLGSTIPRVYGDAERGTFDPSPLRARGHGERGFIDLWPVQTVPASGSGVPSFDTYTLVLQMGTILSMVPHWKELFELRVFVFVEFEEDAEVEQQRVEHLVAGLRIGAQVRSAWLRSRSDDVPSMSQTYEQLLKSTAHTPHMASGRFDVLGMDPETDRLRDGAWLSAGGVGAAVGGSGGASIESVLDALAQPASPWPLHPHRASEYVAFPMFGTVDEQHAHDLESCAECEAAEAAGVPSAHAGLRGAAEATTDPRLAGHAEPPSTPSGRPPSIFSLLPAHTQSIVINELMCRMSGTGETGVVFVTLPAPRPGASGSASASITYLDQLEALTNGLPPTVLVHGRGVTVTMEL
ncbi:hypothetical protein HK105_204074 [Polyrhizophydium stewartii]|uniref:Uncharacterized protein n=1 Tax=Polyrhizophydium stewartii TaxID=2732419 RepID=A0ABR4N9W3_9FUNG